MMTEERFRYLAFRLSAMDFTRVRPRKIPALKNFNADPAQLTAVPGPVRGGRTNAAAPSPSAWIAKIDDLFLNGARPPTLSEAV